MCPECQSPHPQQLELSRLLTEDETVLSLSMPILFTLVLALYFWNFWNFFSVYIEALTFWCSTSTFSIHLKIIVHTNRPLCHLKNLAQSVLLCYSSPAETPHLDLDSLNNTNNFFFLFQIRLRPLLYLVLNQMQPERLCCISSNVYVIWMCQMSPSCAGGGRPGKVKRSCGWNKHGGQKDWWSQSE